MRPLREQLDVAILYVTAAADRLPRNLITHRSEPTQVRLWLKCLGNGANRQKSVCGRFAIMCASHDQHQRALILPNE